MKLITFNWIRLYFFCASVLVVLIQSCLPTDRDNDTSRLPLKILDFKLDTLKKINVQGALQGINIYYQPYGSSNVYFIDEEKKTFSLLDAGKKTFKTLGKFNDFLSSEYFIVEEEKKHIYIFYEDSIYQYGFNCLLQKATSVSGLVTNGYPVVLNSSFLPLFTNDEWYFHHFPDIENSYQDSLFYQQPIEVKINTTTKKAVLLKQIYPANFQMYCYGTNYAPDRIIVDNMHHGYTFPYNDSMFILNIETCESNKKYFGSMRKKTFKYIAFNKINDVNHSIFDKLFIENPNYWYSTHAPLAGYFFRTLYLGKEKITSFNDKKPHFVLYDKQMNYIGESKDSFKCGIIIDSEGGLLSMTFENGVITLMKISW